MGTEEGVTEVRHAESEAEFGVALWRGQVAIGPFGRKLGTDCGFEQRIVEAVAGAGHAW